MPGKVRNGRLVCGEEMPSIGHSHMIEGRRVVCEMSPGHKSDHVGSVNLGEGYTSFWWRFTPSTRAGFSDEFVWRMKRFKNPLLSLQKERQE